MKELFHKLKRVDENRSIMVEELPCGGYGIKGTTFDPVSEALHTSGIRFSPEGAKVLIDILNTIPGMVVEASPVKEEKPQKHYLNKMQGDLFYWDKKNFGDQPAYRSLLGAFEELGELAHAHLKEEQGIRESDYEADAKDAIGDTIIYLANYCNARGFNLQSIISDTWNQVRQRDWVKYPKTGRPEPIDRDTGR